MLHNQNIGHHQQENDDLLAVPCIVGGVRVHLTFALVLGEWLFRMVMGLSEKMFVGILC
tara:strand:- start:202 stop:378 length:177 start_codon:yes stop_codon:yes gene_type:complete